jgi:hypothetical protein
VSLVAGKGTVVPLRRLAEPIAALCVVAVLLLGPTANPSEAATARPPLPSSVSTPDGSWVDLPMGDLAAPLNTFWQVLHAVPGVSHWSVVTPTGVADNGGLVTAAAAASAVVGFLPSQLLQFSPLAQSSTGGKTWTPQFVPAALKAEPDSLASGSSGNVVAAVTGGRVLQAGAALSRWSALVSSTGLGRRFPRCGVTNVDAVSVLPTGAPLVATGCSRGGVLGIFTKAGGTWTSYGTVLKGQGRSATDVLRLEASGPVTTALVLVRQGARQSLIALWRAGSTPWMTSKPLALPSSTSVRASAVGADGAIAVVVGSGTAESAYNIESGGLWDRVPQLPTGTKAIALPGGSATMDGSPIDVFTVSGGALGVYVLTPSGSSWARAQSIQVAIPYGSSS